MEILLRKSFLEHILKKVALVGVDKGANIWLRTFLLELDGNVLKVVRTNMELTAMVHTDKIKVLNAEAPTRVLIGGEKFGLLVPKLDGEEVRLLLTEDRVEIESGRYKGILKPFDISKFPTIATGGGGDVMKLDAQKFARAIKRVSYAASKGQIQDSLRQIVFEEGRCWAFDGFRSQGVVSHLSKGFKLTLPVVAKELAEFIILTKAETLEFEETEEFYFFKIQADLFMCKHSEVIPTSEAALFKKLNEEKQGMFLVGVQKLMHVVERSSFTAEEKSGKVHFEVQDKKLIITAVDKSKNKSEEVLPISLQGNKRKREFDIRWFLLLEALAAINDKSVLVSLDEEFMILKSEDSKALVPYMRKE